MYPLPGINNDSGLLQNLHVHISESEVYMQNNKQK